MGLWSRAGSADRIAVYRPAPYRLKIFCSGNAMTSSHFVYRPLTQPLVAYGAAEAGKPLPNPGKRQGEGGLNVRRIMRIIITETS